MLLRYQIIEILESLTNDLCEDSTQLLKTSVKTSKFATSVMRRGFSRKLVVLSVKKSSEEEEAYKDIYLTLKSWVEKSIQKQSTNSVKRLLINCEISVLTLRKTKRSATTLLSLISKQFL